jgi:hypothetical protein
MSKKINVTLLHKDIVLNFGTGRFYQEYKLSTGEDLLTLSEGFDANKLVGVVQGLVWAGHFSECKKENLPLQFTKEQSFDLVADEEQTWIVDVFNKYTASIKSNGVAPGEIVSQLENQ